MLPTWHSPVDSYTTVFTAYLLVLQLTSNAINRLLLAPLWGVYAMLPMCTTLLCYPVKHWDADWCHYDIRWPTMWNIKPPTITLNDQGQAAAVTEETVDLLSAHPVLYSFLQYWTYKKMWMIGLTSEITDEVSFCQRDHHLHLCPRMAQLW